MKTMHMKEALTCPNFVKVLQHYRRNKTENCKDIISNMWATLDKEVNLFNFPKT